ncbi:MAG: hypothetical protein GY801_28385 [bacterium]|nr:hypothetical protein [bacterium]
MDTIKIQKYLISIISILCLGFIISATAYPQVPRTLNWQAYITNPDGTPAGHPTPEIKTLTFAIYDNKTDGEQLWAEEHTITIEKGKVIAILGKINPIILTEPKAYYLGVTVEGSPEQRRELASTLYALFVDGLTLDKDNRNTFIGEDSGNNNVEGVSNTFIGSDTGYNNNEGSRNIFIGSST